MVVFLIIGEQNSSIIMFKLIRKKASLIITLLMIFILLSMLFLAFFREKLPVRVPAQLFPLAAFEAAKNPLYQYGLVEVNQLQKSNKIYKSIVPLRGDGRYEIKGGELDWHAFNFNGEADITGEGVTGIATDAKIPPNFPREAAELSVKYFENLKTGCYALYDLNADGNDEIIVQSGWGSGGLQYLFLEKQKRKWKVIEGFTGGFVLTLLDLIDNSKKRYSSDYWYVTYWWSSGIDFVQVVDAYRNGQYEEVSSQNVPFAVRELDFGRLNVNAGC